MGIVKKIFLGGLILSLVAVIVLALVVFGPLSGLSNEKPEEGSTWVYYDYSFETEATDSGGLAMAKASAADLADQFKHDVYDLTDLENPKNVSYYDSLTFQDGTIQRKHFERTTSNIDGLDIYTGVEEETLNYGTYDGKKITINEESFEKAFIREGVLYVYVKVVSMADTVAILQFKPAQ